jgi:hypothetical protein
MSNLIKKSKKILFLSKCSRANVRKKMLRHLLKFHILGITMISLPRKLDFGVLSAIIFLQLYISIFAKTFDLLNSTLLVALGIITLSVGISINFKIISRRTLLKVFVSLLIFIGIFTALINISRFVSNNQQNQPVQIYASVEPAQVIPIPIPEAPIFVFEMEFARNTSQPEYANLQCSLAEADVADITTVPNELNASTSEFASIGENDSVCGWKCKSAMLSAGTYTVYRIAKSEYCRTLKNIVLERVVIHIKNLMRLVRHVYRK